METGNRTGDSLPPSCLLAMKPISAASATQPKPYLPPKPIKYRAPLAPASYIDQKRRSGGIMPTPRDQFDQGPLPRPRGQGHQVDQIPRLQPYPGPHMDQGPVACPRDQTDQIPRLQSSPRSQADQGPLLPPSPKNLGKPDREPTARQTVKSLLNSSDRQLRHSPSRSEQMKLERERFLANLVQSADARKRAHSSSGGESATELPRNPSTHSAKSPFTDPNGGSSSNRLNAKDNLTTELQVTLSDMSLTKPNQTSSATKQSTATSSITATVTSSRTYTKPSVLSSKTPPVTSEDVTGGDVIYDEPSVDFEQKSLERMVRSDGYVKLRSDVVEIESIRGTKVLSRLSSRNNDPPDPSRSGMRPSRSSESVDRLDALLDFSDYAGQSGKPLRSSFVDPNGPPSRRSVYIELGEYQTLLKHSRNDEECLYSLPQPLCYSEDTLKAVKLITEKYDTFKRRQLRALSFREGTGTNRKSIHDREPSRTAPESSITESNNNKSNGDCAVQGGAAVPPQIEPESHAKPGTVSVTSTVCDDVAKSRQAGSLLLRDYCNTLETVGGPTDGGSNGGGLSKLNLMRIELFYRSREASVYVCRCLADLFVGTSVGEDSGPVVHQHTGVPLWLLNSGAGVRGRELLLIVAERETGFPLWQDKINYLSNYGELSPGIHSLRVSGSLRKTVQLHMFCELAAAEFLARFHEISADPHDDLWKISSEDTAASSKKKSGQKKKAKKKNTLKRKRSRLSKASISQPCNFVHISRVDPTDPNFRAAFSDLIPIRNGKSPTGSKNSSKAFDSAVSSKDPNKAFDSAIGSKDPSKAFDSAIGSKDPSKAFDNVDLTANDNFESAADCSACEFRPRLPTR